jgi:hypothetical protein
VGHGCARVTDAAVSRDDDPLSSAPRRTALERVLDRVAPPDPRERAGPTHPARWLVGGLVAWAVLVWQAERVGFPMRAVMKVEAAPLTGDLGHPLFGRIPLAVAVGLALAWFLPRWTVRLPWRPMLAVLALAGVVWGMSLAQLRAEPYSRALASQFDYPAVVPQVNRLGVGRFVRTYTDPKVLNDYPIHVQGHPVGAALVFVALDRIGLGGADDAGWVLIALGAGIAPGVLVAVRELAGERRARQAASFLVLGPSVIWLVTSADALYAVVGAWAVALLVLATGAHRSARSRRVLAVGGGALLMFGAHLSYGLVPLAAIPALVVLARRRWTVALSALAGAVPVVLAFVAAGFWIKAGLNATHVRYLDGVSAQRPFRYFTFLGNPAAFFLAAGPVAAMALVRVRDRRLWLLAAGALAAVVASDASGLSKGEVERIWLPFVPWVLVLSAGLWDRHRWNPAELDGSQIPSSHLDGDTAAVAVEDGAAWLLGPRSGGAVARSVPGLVVGLLALQVLAAVLVESVVATPW